MKALIARLLTAYGSTVTVHFEQESRAVRALLQPVTSKSWQNMERMIPVGGQIPRGQFLYIGPPEVDVTQATHLSLLGKTYLVRRVDRILYRDQVLYLWGLLVEGGREDPWSES